MPDLTNTACSPFEAPWMLIRLTTASWESIFYRTVSMASGTCSAAEYRGMIAEKMDACHSATLALMTGQGGAAAITPYLAATTASAKRLRA